MRAWFYADKQIMLKKNPKQGHELKEFKSLVFESIVGEVNWTRVYSILKCASMI